MPVARRAVEAVLVAPAKPVRVVRLGAKFDEAKQRELKAGYQAYTLLKPFQRVVDRRQRVRVRVTQPRPLFPPLV